MLQFFEFNIIFHIYTQDTGLERVHAGLLKFQNP